MLYRILLITTLYSLIFSHSALTQVTADQENATDEMGIGRYPGTFISHHIYNEYDTYTFPLETYTDEHFKRLKLEGERTTIVYDVPIETTTSRLKVFRSIEKSLVNKGFETSVSCTGEGNPCGGIFFLRAIVANANTTYPTFKQFSNLNDSDSFVYAGKAQKEGQNIYILVVVAKSKYASFMQYSFDILKETELQVEELVLTEEGISKDLNEKGKVKLSGIYFDNDSATLKPESDTALTTLVNYLQAHPQLSYLVVGHTDSQGSYEHNITLSSLRANAVLASLKKRLPKFENIRSIGVGFAAPEASNTHDNGRQLNRRVELVVIP